MNQPPPATGKVPSPFTRRRALLPALLAAIPLCASVASAQFVLEPLWDARPGTAGEPNTDHPFLLNDSTHRGLAYNPATGNLLVVSRAVHDGTGVTATNGIFVLDGESGDVLHSLDGSTIAGGTFPLNMVGVAGDGSVYVCNLAAATTGLGFKVYRYPSDAPDTAPVVIFEATTGLEPGARTGDSMDVRGSGADTRILFGPRTGDKVTLLTTTDGISFTATVLTTDTAADSLGIAFGEGDSFWCKAPNTPLRHFTYDADAGTATLVNSITTLSGSIAPLGTDPANQLLAGVDYATHQVSLLDISDPASPSLQDTVTFPNPTYANGGGTGAADFGDDLLFALDTNSGITAHRLVQVDLPVVNGPDPATVLEGGYITLTVAATGAEPLGFQWFFNGSPIEDATENSLLLTDVSPGQEGAYHAEVSNSFGTTAGDPAAVTVLPTVRSPLLTPVWSLSPGDRPYLGTDNAQRGLAFNPSNTNLLLISRTSGANIHVLDGTTGEDLHTLDVDPNTIFGGIFILNMIGAADDGAVYAANLELNASSAFFPVYRWADDDPATPPTLAYFEDPGSGTANRWGDTFDVRGAGSDTQILLTSRSGTQAAILTTADGLNFTHTTIEIAGASNGDFGLGAAFGDGNTFWAKATGRALFQVEFNLEAGTGTIVNTFTDPAAPADGGPIGVDAANDLLGMISIQTPDNLRLYDIADTANPPVWLDTEFFPTDNGNSNGTGAVDFGGGMAFALASNNGIIALAVDLDEPSGIEITGITTPPGTGEVELTWTTTAGATYRVESLDELGGSDWTDLSGPLTATGNSLSHTDTGLAGVNQRYYRIVRVP